MKFAQRFIDKPVILKPDMSIQALLEQLQEVETAFDQSVEAATELKDQLNGIEGKIFHLLQKEALLKAIINNSITNETKQEGEPT